MYVLYSFMISRDELQIAHEPDTCQSAGGRKWGAGRMRLLLPTGVYINGYWVLFILFPIKRLKYLTYNAARIISLKVEPPERKSLNRKITNTES